MRVMAIEEFGGAQKLKPMALPRPLPKKGEVLVRVVAAGVSSVDARICEGQLNGVLQHRFPLVPGWEVAGVVEEFGEGAGRFRKGDRVWALARKPVLQWGCYAEYVSVPENGMALMPAKLLYEEAAAVPLGALTAHQCLYGKTGLERDSTVLIHAAAGGVGHLAVQLARNAGARVIGTAGADKRSFVMGLGAESVIDYTRDDFREVVRRSCPDGVDLVIDTIGGETLRHSFEVLRPGGRLVSLIEEPPGDCVEHYNVTAHFMFVEPSAEQLELMAQLFDHKRLTTHVQKIYPLSSAAEALRIVADGHVQGKLVLNL